MMTHTCRVVAFPPVLAIATPIIPCRARLCSLMAEGLCRRVSFTGEKGQGFGNEFDCKILRLLCVYSRERRLECCGVVAPNNSPFFHYL